MIKRKVPEDYHSLAKRRGFVWLGPEVPIVSTKTWWKCSKDHRWETRYSSIQQGKGCPYCAGKARKTSADYHTTATENNIKWLGPFPDTVMGRTDWECLSGHMWTTSYNKIQQGRGCPHCYGNVRKISADYYKLAEARNIKWLGPVPANGSITKTWWECQERHKWKASYSKIQLGRGCPDCHLERKLRKPYDYHSLAGKRGFSWLGSFPQTTRHKTQWQCSQGPKWMVSYSSFQQGVGCPYCIDRVNGYQVSRPQRELCEMASGELNYPCGSYRIDVALPKEKIAIEYDSWYWHGRKQDLDRIRDSDLVAGGWRVLHVKSNGKLPTTQQLDDSLIRLRGGQEITEIILDDWGQGSTFMELRK